MDCNERSVPLSLDLVDTWAEGSSLTGKAIRVKLGTPAQDVLLFPAFTQDDLHVYNHTVQYVERPTLHLDLEGLGVYNWDNSTTFHATTLTQWNGSTPNWDPSLYSVFNDALEVDGKVRLDGFPMFTAVVPEGFCMCPQNMVYPAADRDSPEQLTAEHPFRILQVPAIDWTNPLPCNRILAWNQKSRK
jgi:hypothetical protein